MKFLADSVLASIYLVSEPGAIPCVKEYLKLSAPYLSITSNGSIPFPKDLLIFLPCASLTIP